MWIVVYVHLADIAVIIQFVCYQSYLILHTVKQAPEWSHAIHWR